MIRLTEVGLVSHLLAATAYGVLLVAALRRGRSGLHLWLALAALASLIWAAAFVGAMLIDDAIRAWLSPLQSIKIGAWIGLLLFLLRPAWIGAASGGTSSAKAARSAFSIGTAVGFVLALQLVVDSVGAGAGALTGEGGPVASLFLVSRIAVAVTGLVLCHNLFVTTPATERAGLRLLAIGIGGLFLYELNFTTLAFLLPPGSQDLYNIRGAAEALLALLFLFASRDDWVKSARISRRVAFQTVAFSGVGFYLIAMAVLAYGLKLLGGSWGALLQVTFLFATALLGVVVMVSQRFRAWLRGAIARNFYSYRYDYRTEWLRFIATLSAPGDATGLPERVVQAVASLLDARGGWLLAPQDDELEPTATWAMGDARPQPLAMASPLVDWVAGQERVLDLDQLRAGEIADAPALPDWLAADARFWLVVPAFNRDSLAGLLLIGRSLVPRRLGWEEEELLKTLGRQAGSYIAESRSQAALDEARRFEEFNRRFAFILHDIKNLVSQLSLLARNAERHADNPDFRADMIATLKGSVDKMNGLLAWLSQRAAGGAANDADVAIDALLRQIVRARQAAWPALALDLPADEDLPLVVRGDEGRLEQMVAHLLQNAFDASPPGAPIRVAARVAGDELVITLADSGHGMSARFIREELFQPFHSSKPGGFGIGAFEAREIVRSHGGRLDVASREGEGTCFTITLPLARARRDVPAALRPLAAGGMGVEGKVA